MPEQVAENPEGAREATTGAEARIDSYALRGAEAPLFHDTAGVPEFFRDL